MVPSHFGLLVANLREGLAWQLLLDIRLWRYAHEVQRFVSGGKKKYRSPGDAEVGMCERYP